MDWGMKNRMNRLFKEDGRCFFLPVDHGYFQGPTHCLEKPAETIRPLIPYCDALFVTRGVLRAAIEASCPLPVILRVSGGPTVVGKDLADEVITTSVDEIVRLNATAVGVSVFIGTDYEKQTLQNLSELVNACEPCGIPVMAVTAVGKELEKRSARYLGLCCRVCAELGARVVKTYWCEEFDKVTSGCPVPVVMAGGPKCETAVEVMAFVHDGMRKGAVGVNLGRNVWQSPHRAPMARSLQAIIHENATVAQAKEVFDEMVNSGK